MCKPQKEFDVKKALLAIAVSIVLAGGIPAGNDHDDDHESDHLEFKPGTLVLSRSVYNGTASTVTVGQTLPPGCVAGTVTLPKIPSGTTTVTVTCATATADGTYPTIFENDVADASFGVTSPIFLDNITKNGKLLGT